MNQTAAVEKSLGGLQEQHWKALAPPDDTQVGTVDRTDGTVAAGSTMAAAVDLAVEDAVDLVVEELETP